MVRGMGLYLPFLQRQMIGLFTENTQTIQIGVYGVFLAFPLTETVAAIASIILYKIKVRKSLGG